MWLLRVLEPARARFRWAPDDPILPGGDPSPKPNGDDSPPPAPDPAPGAALTLEQVADQVKSQTAPIAQAVSQLTQAMGQLQESVRPKDPPQTQETADFQERLISNPEETIKDLAKQVAQETSQSSLGQLTQLQSLAHTLLVNDHQARVDAEFGSGTWEQEFAPDLKTVFDDARKSNSASLVDPNAMQAVVNSLKGMKIDKLIELKSKAKESSEKSNEEEANKLVDRIVQSGNLTGGIRRISPTKPTLDAEQREILKDRFKHTGEDVNEKELLALMGSGSSLKDYQAAMSKLKEGSK